jgi:hypothetical protein
MMLAPHEFMVGSLCDAAGMTLMLPRGSHDATALITSAPGNPTAVFLEGEFRFSSFACGDNTSWSGILIPDVSIEIDETSATDFDSGTPLGTLIRNQAQLIIVAKRKDHYGGPGHVPLIVNLRPCREGQSAGFTRWRVMIGEGLLRREIKMVDVSLQTSTARV